MHRDTVSLIKQSGQRFDGIKAGVQEKMIFIHDATLLAEDGDIIERVLPNGITERFTILDTGFHKGLHSIPDHFQMKVRKETSLMPGGQATVSHTYNLHGANARVNISSTDNSQNFADTSNQALFADIRKALESIPDAAEREGLLPYADELEKSQGTPAYMPAYQAFVQNAANHMTLVGPFIPALSKLLGVG
jgi:hypothetical protein